MNRPQWLTLEKLKRLDDEGNSEYHAAVIPSAIIVAGILLYVLLLVLRPVPARVSVEKVAALVTVQELVPSDERSAVSGFGTVRARKAVQVYPQVSGKIVKIDERLLPGARFSKGELLFQIDPKDYELAVKMKEAALATAKFQYQLELGNQVVAKREFELLEKDMPVSDLGKQLALRQPHLEEKEAALKAAESELEQAKLDLSRTEIRSPFDSVVLSESVEEGQFVSPTAVALTIAATDEFLIEVKIPRRELSFFDFSNSGEPAEPYPVQVVQRVGPGQNLRWEGRVLRLLSNVDENGRMAGIIVAVRDPLRATTEHSPLLLGSYVEVKMEAKVEKGVYEVPRKSVREGDVIWVVGDGKKLVTKDVSVIFSKDEKAYIRGDLADYQQIITSNLPNALEGMLLEVQGAGDSS